LRSTLKPKYQLTLSETVARSPNRAGCCSGGGCSHTPNTQRGTIATWLLLPTSQRVAGPARRSMVWQHSAQWLLAPDGALGRGHSPTCTALPSTPPQKKQKNTQER
jgi:hypothetical protein